MKAIKIIFAVAVIAIIGFFVWKWLVKIEGVGAVTPPKNQFITRIESEINSLIKSPKNVFCQKFYKDIQYHITDYHKQGFLGKTESDNNQWKEILSKNLYSAYAPKFAEQTMHVFNGLEWKINDLKFIHSEVLVLQSSTYLEQSSPVATSFKNIRMILAKYDEIAGFISTCNNFSYSYYSSGDQFPDVSDKIQKSRAYLSNNLDNSYVNNCTRLKDGLHEIPQKLFDKHISYLHTKIQKNSSRYNEYKYQSDYSNNIYTPLRNQIDALNNDIYGINDNTFNSEYSSLDNLLGSYNRQATDYFRQLNNR